MESLSVKIHSELMHLIVGYRFIPDRTINYMTFIGQELCDLFAEPGRDSRDEDYFFHTSTGCNSRIPSFFAALVIFSMEISTCSLVWVAISECLIRLSSFGTAGATNRVYKDAVSK